MFDLHTSGLPLAVDRRDSPVLLSQLLSSAASDHHNVQITQRLGHLNPFRPLVQVLPGLRWDCNIQRKDRGGNRGCWASDPPGAAIMAVESWNAQNRQSKQ